MEDKAVWEPAVGDTAQLLERKGRYADLIIVGQTQQENNLSNYHRLSDNLVMMAGRPVLVIPDIGIGDSIDKKVLVAWNGSREAGRAVWPFKVPQNGSWRRDPACLGTHHGSNPDVTLINVTAVRR